MKIHLNSEYKSLKPFISDELNGFSIITGKNGCGKTQLLDLITKKHNNDGATARVQFELVPKISRLQFEGIIKENPLQINHDHWKNIVKRKYEIFKNMKPSVRNLRQFIEDKMLVNKVNDASRKELLSNDREYKAILERIWSENNSRPLPSIEQISIQVEQKILRNHMIEQEPNILLFVKELCGFTKKQENQLTEGDFYNTPISEHHLDENDLFHSKIELIFYNYAKRRFQNRLKWFFKQSENEENNSISDEEFVAKSTPPWNLINEILTSHKIDFYFKGIDKTDFSPDVSIDLNLYKKSTNQLIPFSDLSSGEKVIMGLVLKLFTSEYYENGMTFPELLILDEPDAHLHPEMSMLLLNVLRDTFVEKYGIKVIISTHSPSTIALANENQIYQLENGDKSSLRKTSKDDALNILTGFLPTLSIDYKNHRQVFVESPTDVEYFRHLHDKHFQYNAQIFKLYFISNSPGKSNCSQVYKIVEEIRGSGNTSSFGIVDWDLSNEPKPFIYVHGKNERYSIENFILDPIYIICLLIESNDAHGISEKIGISKTYNQYLLGNENQQRLNEITKIFFKEFENRFQSYKYESEKFQIKYLNNRIIDIPKWYCQMKGHDIVEKLKKIFPAIEGKFQKEGELQKHLSIIMVKCYPFVPQTSIDVIQKIGNGF